MQTRIVLLILVLTLGIFAVEGAISVYTVEKEDRFVSEEIILKVDLKTTAFTIKNAKIQLENTKDYVVLAPMSAAYLETVEIDDEQWQVVHYEYKLYPLHAGKIRLEPIDISFNVSMGYGQPEKQFSLRSDTVVLDIVAPQGVHKNAFVLSTPSYVLKSEVTPKFSETNVSRIKVGDAIELKITQEAKNVPDFLLKPIHFREGTHFKIYTEEPILKSKALDTETIATRTDAFTFVASKEGNGSIPSQTLIWWDPVAQVLHKEKTRALHFTVLVDPKAAASLTSLEEEKEEKPWVLNLVLILILIAVLSRLIPIIKKKKIEKKVAYLQSEEGKFERLLATSKGDDMAKLYRDFYTWLEVADPKLSRAGFRGVVEVQPSFSKVLGSLEIAFLGPEKVFEKKEFGRELLKLRASLLAEKQGEMHSLPKKINPN